MKGPFLHMPDVRMGIWCFSCGLLLAVALCGSSWAEGTPSDPEAPAATAPASPTPEAPALPKIDVYFPEGKLDLSLSRLIKNALFEGQIKYNFVRGDISAFLRYRYYGHQNIYQLGLFDAVEFENVEDFDNDFERVRGLLFLVQRPRNRYSRTFFLAQLERLSSSKEELRFDNNQTHTFLRVGYQLGSPEDARSNAIVGETRARREALFTANRELSPWKGGLTTALTYAFDFTAGDFEYLKFELEGFKRLDVTDRSFVVVRLHGGTFLSKKEAENRPSVVEDFERFAIPVAELFRLDGRENLKGVSDRLRGTEQVHSTVEYFIPWFEDRNRRFFGLDWQNFYWVLYSGLGTVGYERSVFTDWDSYYPDVGFGLEASFKLKSYKFFLGALVAQAQQGDNDIETQITLRSYR